MSALRGFGMTFDVASGTVRNWYIARDGAKRWADNDELVRGLAGLQETPTMSAYDAVLRNFTEEWRKQEAEHGICCDEDVAPEDREPPTTVGISDAIPMPVDPYGCENPVSQSEEE
jgi:hypothetical protein